jgi:beta-glucanase (GH16 family)
MKISKCLGVLLLCVAQSAPVLAAPPAGYVKVWEDNFDGPTLNTANWTLGYKDSATGDMVPGAVGAMLLNQTIHQGYITPEDLVFANGTVSLLNQRRTVQGTSPTGAFNFTSATLISMHKVHTNKGYFEWRAKFPVGNKVWPAFWLGAENLVWGPEWDCFEYYGYLSSAQTDAMGMHLMTGVYPGATKWSSGWIQNFNSIYDAGKWHTYGFEWTDTFARWTIDDVEVRRLNNTLGADWPNQEMYMILNNSVGASFPDTNTAFPNALEIDYVALYKKVDAFTFTNPSFEANGPGKQPGSVPTGWSTDAPSGSGLEPFGASDGVNAALLDWRYNAAGSNQNPGYSLFQTSPHTLLPSDRYTVSFDARRTWTTTADWGRVRAAIYYVDGNGRHELTSTTIDLPDSGVKNVTLDLASVDAAAVGRPVGVSFRSESWGATNVSVDNVKVSVPAPAPIQAPPTEGSASTLEAGKGGGASGVLWLIGLLGANGLLWHGRPRRSRA